MGNDHWRKTKPVHKYDIKFSATSDVVRSKKHPIVIVGQYKNKYLGVGITSDPDLANTIRLNKNPQASFAVNAVILRDKDKFESSKHGEWKLDPSDYEKIDRIVMENAGHYKP